VRVSANELNRDGTTAASAISAIGGIGGQGGDATGGIGCGGGGSAGGGSGGNIKVTYCLETGATCTNCLDVSSGPSSRGGNGDGTGSRGGNSGASGNAGLIRVLSFTTGAITETGAGDAFGTSCDAGAPGIATATSTGAAAQTTVAWCKQNMTIGCSGGAPSPPLPWQTALDGLALCWLGIAIRRRRTLKEAA
jgi:hypothetical protein